MTVTSGQTAAPALAEDGAFQPRQFARRFLQGDLGSLRVILGLVIIWIIFQSQNDRFLSAVNLTNLVLQVTAVGLISVGIVLVLLLGEIDLSVGAVSGVTSAIMAVANVKHGWAPVPALALAILAGAAIGLLQGFVLARFGVPSFVVTLAGLLGWQGAQLYVLGDTGTININDPTIVGLTGTFYSTTVSWVIAAVAIGAYVLASLVGRRRRAAARLPVEPLPALVLRLAAVSGAAIAAVAITTSDRGLPLAGLILVAFVVLFDWLVRRTQFGRHVFAVGGNAEAARRAGIRVERIRIVVFALSGTMAAIGGIMAASRLLAVNQSSGGSDLLLIAIAGPVVAGTSLFGGRGSVWSALLGALVIGSISNGMDLLALESSVKFMITGAVLLLAVVIDAIARKQRRAAGRL